MSETQQAIRCEVDADGVATLTLDQAARGNPIDGEFCAAFRRVALGLWDTPGLRVVHLRAEGKNFSLGGDLKSFYPKREALPPVVRAWTADLHMGLARFAQLPVPTVVEVQGFAMGGAVALLAGCDVVVAARSARFGSAFAQIGYSCDSGSSSVLSFRMGAARARRFVMLAEVLDAAEAERSGLVDRVVDDGELAVAAGALAQQLARGPTLAFGEIKRLFLKAGRTPFEAQLEDEALTLARVAGSSDAKEGIAAFVERRKPDFTGR